MNAKKRDAITVAGLYEAGVLRDLDVQMIESLSRSFGQHGESQEIVKVILALALRVMDNGHVCLDLGSKDWEQIRQNAPDSEQSKGDAMLSNLPTPDDARTLLANDHVLVGDENAKRPFVLEGTRLYLRRFSNYEKEVAATLLSLASDEEKSISPEIEQAIESYKLKGGNPLAAGQKEAIRTGLKRRLTIITGGPGTGKTTVAAALLKMLAKQQAGGLRLRIRLAAPTGKAAMRLYESVASEMAGAPDIELEPAKTIERLLGSQSGSPYFRHNKDHPLSADVVIVDEASMIDLPKMAKLLDALDKESRLVLLGDKNQLASVDPGSVMAEICEARALDTCLARLTENKRFGKDSAIAPLSDAVNDQQADKAWDILRSNAGAEGKKAQLFDAKQFARGEPPQEFISAVKARFAEFMQAGEPAAAFAALAKFRVLCALRRGPFGVHRINALIEDALLPNRRGEFYDHRPILVTKNDYEIKLFNGDIGVVLPDPERNGDSAVFFEGRSRSLPCHLLPPHETAFAMTVHKAQGSGFNHVLVLLPDCESPVLTRELIYTAITRTETGVDLWCEEHTFKKGVLTETRRSMGLKERLDSAQPRGYSKL